MMISFDIDGVLANFTRGFTKIAHQLYGTPIGDGTSQETWNFEDYPALKLTKEQCDFKTGKIWEVLKLDPSFWATLDPFNPSVMPRIGRIKNRMFITNRVGVDPLKQTQWFLKCWGIYEPQIIVAANKGPVAAEHNVIAHVDDYYPNCVDIKAACPHAFVALHYTPYNKIHHAEWTDNGGAVTLSVDHFIDECEKRGYVEYR